MALLDATQNPMKLGVFRISASGRLPDGITVLASILFTGLIVLVCAATSPVLIHWFLFPLFACGALIGIDLIEWLRGRIDLFDPAGMVGILGFHFFFVAPLLLVAWGYRMRFLPEQPDDYRPWLGLMALLNCFGLLLYRKVVATMQCGGRVSPHLTATRWAIQRHRFWITLILLVSASIGTEAWMLVRFGGISGYVAAYSAWLQGGGDSFEGAALLFAISESLPILLLMAFAFWAQRSRPKLWLLILSFTLFVALDFLIGGLRGSRSNVIWTIFWGAGIVHLYVRRIPRTLAIGSLVMLYAFVSVYAAYKQHGSDLLTTFNTTGEYSSLNDGAEDGATVLVGDFSRADVQANLLWKLNESQVPYAWGQTYLGALAMLVPKSIWPARPPTIVRWSTDAEYGEGSYDAGLTHSTRVYGAAGEAMLNVGPFGVPIALLLLGFGVGALRRFRDALNAADGRLMLVPFFVNLVFLLLLNDADNVVFYLVKYGLVPTALLVFSCQRLIRRVVPCKLLPQPPIPAIPVFNSTSIARPRSTWTTRLRSIATP